MIKQTVESTDRLQVLDFGSEKGPANLGSFQDVVYAHQASGTLELGLRWELAERLRIMNPEKNNEVLFEDKEVGFELSMTESEKRKLVVSQLVYTFAGHRFSMRREKQGTYPYRLSVTPNQDFDFRWNQGRQWDLPAPVKCYRFPNEVNARYQNAGFLADLQLAFERLFTGMKYLGPLREYPKRQYPWCGGEPVDMGQRGERVIEAILAAREAGKKISRGKGKKRQSLEERVAEWLKQLNVVVSFVVEPLAKESNIYRVRV